MQGLVGGPEVDDFLVSSQIDTGLKLAVGDPRVDAMVGPDIIRAQIALREGSKKVMALAKDPTRNEVQRHEAARKVAIEVEAAVSAAHVAIKARADELYRSGLQEADLAFAPRASRGAIESELRGWIKEQGKKNEGLDHIKKAMAENPEVAAVIWHSPRYLLGLSSKMYELIRMEALEKHQPATTQKLSASMSLDKMAERCRATARRVGASYFSPALADQAKRRVDVP